MSSLSPVSWFSDESQSLRNQIEEFGEPFEVRPHMQEPNMASRPDPSRPIIRLSAVFEREGRNVKAGEDDLHISSRDPVITVQRCDLPYALKRTDRLVHLVTNEIFEVTNPLPDGLSAVKLDVVQLGRPK